MSSPPDKHATIDRRSFYRCAAENERFACLQLGEAQFPALIADESVQGFGILVHSDAQCEVGKLVMLKTESGWSECEVMNLRLLDDVLLDEDDPQSGSPLRIGLLRVKDVESDENQRFSWRQLLSLGPRKVALATLGHPIGGAVVFTILLVVVVGVLIWSLEGPGLVRVTRSEPTDELPQVIEPRKKIIVSEEDAPKAPPRPRKKLGQAAEDVVKDVASLVNEIRVPRNVIRGSMPTRLLDPDVVRRLSLDERQLSQLRRLLQEQEALDLLQNQADLVTDAVRAGAEMGERAVHEQKALALGRRALEVLSEEQRKEWELLVSSQSTPVEGAPAPTQQTTGSP